MNTRSRENDVIELNRPVSHRFSNLENRSLLNKIVTGVLLDSSKSHRRIFVSSYMLFLYFEKAVPNDDLLNSESTVLFISCATHFPVNSSQSMKRSNLQAGLVINSS